MADDWFYARGTKKSGPMPLEDLKQRVAIDGRPSNALVWREGFEGWLPVATVAELKVVGPPPLPGEILNESDVPIANEKSATRTVLEYVIWAVSFLVGAALVRIFGTLFFWPAALISLAWLLLAKYKVDKVLIPMLAIVLGHTGWMLVGHSALLWLGAATNETWLFSLDLITVLAITVLILKQKSVETIGGLLVYQMFVLTTGGFEMLNKTALLAPGMHFILRIAGVAAAIYGLVALLKLRNAQKV